MARIAGIELPKEKQLEIGLTYIYGIGLTSSQKIIAEAKLDGTTRVKNLSESEVNKLREIIEKSFKVEGDLGQEVSENIRRLKDIGSYSGLRHKSGLPLRGQRTRTNARTKRGKRLTVGSGRKSSKNEGRV